MGEWIDQLWYVHTVEYYPLIKRDELLMHATTWKNLRNIMLSERGQTQKSIYYINPFI